MFICLSQPNGSIELEEKYKTISLQSHTRSSSQVEIAELVLLNSSRYICIGITPPKMAKNLKGKDSTSFESSNDM